MYTKENNINKLYDLLSHIATKYKVDSMLIDEDGKIIALKSSQHLVDGVFCINFSNLTSKCDAFFETTVNLAIEKGCFSGLCWAQIRTTLLKYTINDTKIIVALPKYLLDTDLEELDKNKIMKCGGTDDEIRLIKAIHNKLPVITKEIEDEIFEIFNKCLLEFSERGILRILNES